jgi:hypothetical protein
MGVMIRVLNNYPAQFASYLMKFVVVLPWGFRAPSTKVATKSRPSQTKSTIAVEMASKDCCPEYLRTNFGIFTVQAFPSLISDDTA